MSLYPEVLSITVALYVNYDPLSINRFIWRKTWNENVHLEITSSENGEFNLKIQPGLVVVGVGDRENIEGLRTYLESATPGIVAQLNHLRVERENVVTHFENFRATICLIMRDVRWNRGFKGRCGWERGFWILS